MKSKISFTIFFVLIGLVVLVGILFALKENSSTVKTVKVTDYGFSVCTQDIPSSDCSSYDVTVQATDGKITTYKVAGYSNRDSKLYDKVTPKISIAKEQKTNVTIKVNDKGEIISIQ